MAGAKRPILVLLIAASTWRPTASAAPLIGDPFPIAADAVHELAPAVAHAPERHSFVVVWQAVGGDSGGAGEISGGPILARVVTEQGALGPIMFVGDGMTPDIARNDAADQFLVRSTDPDNEIRGRRLTGEGEPMGEAFPISAGRPDSELRPAVAFNGHPQYRNYLVVWEDGVDDLTGSMTRWGIWAQRVSGTGEGEPLIGAPIEVADAGPGAAQNRDPDVAYNLNRNEYLVAYTYYPSGAFGTTPDVRARRVTADGEPLPEQTVDDASEGQFAPAIAAYPPNAMAPFLVVYGDTSTSLQGDVRGHLLTADGAGGWTFDDAGGLTGPNVTATSTDAQGNTSEFSAPVSLTPASPSPTAMGGATPPRTQTSGPTGTPTVTPATPPRPRPAPRRRLGRGPVGPPPL